MDIFIQKAMAKSSADRYQTPQEFVAALDQLQERIQAMPTSKRVAEPAYEPKSGNIGGAKLPVAPPKQARLVVLSSGQPILLTGDLMVVGRQDPILGIFPEINLADKTVGRRHAYLRHQHGTYTVEDLNALNKTRLNGVTLTPHEERTLKDGDILRFGSVEVRFELR